MIVQTAKLKFELKKTYPKRHWVIRRPNKNGDHLLTIGFIKWQGTVYEGEYKATLSTGRYVTSEELEEIEVALLGVNDG